LFCATPPFNVEIVKRTKSSVVCREPHEARILHAAHSFGPAGKITRSASVESAGNVVT
jgi:hypothetical protein